MQTFTNCQLVSSLIQTHVTMPFQKIESHRVICYKY
jgi:hypothetical protein